MSSLGKMLEQLERVTRQRAADLVLSLPKPQGCGCKRRAERMARQLRENEPLVRIVRDMLDDLRGKRFE